MIGTALVVGWLSVPILWLAGLPGLGLGVLWLWSQRRRRRALVLLALSPLVALPVLSVLGASAGYWSGTAVLKGSGLPGISYRNLDPVIRCSRQSSGCMVDGSEILTHSPHNLALRVWGALCGPMPRSYRGPLPSEEEALALLAASGREERWSDLREGRALVEGVNLGGEEFDCLSSVEPVVYVSHPALGQAPSVRLAVLEGGAAIVLAAGNELMVLDLDTGRRVARWNRWDYPREGEGR